MKAIKSRAQVAFLAQPVSRLAPSFQRAIDEDRDLMALYLQRGQFLDEIRRIDKLLADGIVRSLERRIASH